jgi:hypothetical protein
MKTFFILILVSLCTTVWAETLTFPKFKVSAKSEWVIAPTATKETIMSLQFLDDRNEAVEVPAILSVDLFMPQMGHGSGPTALERVLDQNDDITPGLWKVKNMWFIMKGLWEVRVTLKKGTKTETSKFDVQL